MDTAWYILFRDVLFYSLWLMYTILQSRLQCVTCRMWSDSPEYVCGFVVLFYFLIWHASFGYETQAVFFLALGSLNCQRLPSSPVSYFMCLCDYRQDMSRILSFTLILFYFEPHKWPAELYFYSRSLKFCGFFFFFFHFRIKQETGLSHSLTHFLLSAAQMR